MKEWLADLWHYRELLYFLAWRDVKVRYKQAALGASWAIIQPLFTMIIFTLFFGRVAGMASEGIPYPLFSFCALVPWTYFSSTLSQAGNSLISNIPLVTKVYFPRVLLPAAAVLSGMLDFLISCVFLGLMLIYYHVRPGLLMLAAPVFVIGLVVFSLSVGMFLAALNVRYRDVKYALPFIVQIWLFVTPIIYPIAFLPKKLRPFVAFNPMAGVVEGLRAAVLSTHVEWSSVMISSAMIVALAIGSAMYFRRTERSFADIV